MNLENFRHAGLLLMRLGLGGMMIYHGWPKLISGPGNWAKLGAAMRHVGIDQFPVGWGFAATMSETLGGLFLALGLFTRPAAALLMITMMVAARSHFVGEGLFSASHAIEVGISFLGLVLIGPGKASLDHSVRKKKV